MKNWEHDAYHQIRNTLTRYTWFGDFGDEEGFVSLFTPDAVLSIKGREVYEGTEGIRRLMSNAYSDRSPEQLAQSGPLRHHVSSIRIEIESEHLARAWSYFINLGPHGLDHWGRYADELVPGDGIWLFRRRRVSIDGATDVSAQFPDGLPK
jgi:SnoaL-like domain